MGISTPIIVAEKSAKVFSNSTGTPQENLERLEELAVEKSKKATRILRLEGSVSDSKSILFARKKYDDSVADSKKWKALADGCTSRSCKNNNLEHYMRSWSNANVGRTKWAKIWKDLKAELIQRKQELASIENEINVLNTQYQQQTGQTVNTSTGNLALDQVAEETLEEAQSIAGKTGISKPILYGGIGILALVGIVVAVKMIRR